MKYKEWLNSWLECYIKPTSKQKTYNRYSEIVEQQIKIRLANYEMDEISQMRDWCRQTIRYILTNEKYIGDTMWQKSFTPTVLPLRNRPNRGELPKYYCEGTQEAIVSKDDFLAVQNLMREREKKHYKGYKQKDEKVSKSDPIKNLFYRKIVCRHCGWSYKTKQTLDGYVWTCSKKGLTNEKCTAVAYSKEELTAAFIRMYNILKQNKRVLIDETISQLQMLKVKSNSGNNDARNIRTYGLQQCKFRLRFEFQ